MRRGVALFPLFAALACQGGGLAYEGEPGRETPATLEDGVPVTRASVAGLGAGNFLVDTGAPFSALDPDAFELPVGRHALSLEAFHLHFPRVELEVFDLFPGGPDAAAIGGILGGDLLRHFSLSLDYRQPRVWLRAGWDGRSPEGVAPDSVEGPAVAPARVRGGGRRFLVDLALEEGEPAVALVDTGASTVLLDEALMARLGDRGRPRLRGVTVATADGPREAYFTRVWRLRLEVEQGEITQESVAALVIPETDIFDTLEAEANVRVEAIVGSSFLRRYLTTVDYVGRALVLEPYIATEHIDPEEFVRVGFTLERAAGAPWTVGEVFADTDAEREGLEVGETIADIDGTAIEPLNSGEVGDLLAGFTLGEQVPIGVERAGGVETLLIEVEDLLPSFESL